MKTIIGNVTVYKRPDRLGSSILFFRTCAGRHDYGPPQRQENLTAASYRRILSVVNRMMEREIGTIVIFDDGWCWIREPQRDEDGVHL